MEQRRIVTDDDRFEGEQVVLRLVTLEDCTLQYVEWLRDPDVSRYLETRWTPVDEASVRAFVARMRASAADYLFAMTLRDGRHIGNIKLGSMNAHHHFGDVSYFIGERDVWGRGLATDAITTVIRLAFERCALHRVEAGVYAGNVASVRALEKSGLVHEATLRGRFWSGDGWQDHLLYGALRDEWLAARPKA